MTKKLRNDIFLAGGILLAAAAALLLFFLLRTDGAVIVVLIDGEETARYPLDQELTVRIGGQSAYNVLVIRDGQAWVSEASCPDKVCVHQGPIQYAGETIVCIPNHLVLQVMGAPTSGVDAAAD